MGQAGDVEDGSEVTVAGDEGRRGDLEVGLGELGFEKRVGLGVASVRSISVRSLESGVWGPVFWGGRGRRGGRRRVLGGGVERCAPRRGDGGGEGGAVEDTGVAEDVHEQGVGAGGGVELHPLPVVAALERREAVWGLARRRSQSGLAQMAA